VVAKGMDCPGCRAVLTERGAAELSLLRCDACGGLWADNAVSQRVSSATLSEPARAFLLELEREVAAAPSPGAVESAAARACPACGDAMPEVTIPHTGVKVDVCASHGTWFDRHELVRVYQAIEIKNVDDDEAANEFAQDLTEDRRGRAMRGSFLGRVIGLLRGS